MPVLTDVVVPVTEAEEEAPAEAPADEPAAWTPDESAWQEEPVEESPAPPPSPAYADVPEASPDTQAVDALGTPDPDDEASLGELRKAMTDESPVGPRDDDEALCDEPDQSARSRFGRRR
jgi:hypothetical protein